MIRQAPSSYKSLASSYTVYIILFVFSLTKLWEKSSIFPNFIPDADNELDWTISKYLKLKD